MQRLHLRWLPPEGEWFLAGQSIIPYTVIYILANTIYWEQHITHHHINTITYQNRCPSLEETLTATSRRTLPQHQVIPPSVQRTPPNVPHSCRERQWVTAQSLFILRARWCTCVLDSTCRALLCSDLQLASQRIRRVMVPSDPTPDSFVRGPPGAIRT
ncbi:hypothetical protein FKM82_019128 [Ascaphus truei]